MVTQKYVDALPLYRQPKIFKRHGIEIADSTLGQWVMRAAQAVEPLVAQIQAHILQQPVIGMDETTVQVLKEPGKTAQSKSYMWVMRADLR